MNKQSKIVGANLTQLRKILNLNQVEFAEMLGVSQGAVSKIEEGKLEPGMRTLDFINLLGLDLNQLFNEVHLIKMALLEQEIERLQNINGPAIRLLEKIKPLAYEIHIDGYVNDQILDARLSRSVDSIDNFFKYIKKGKVKNLPARAVGKCEVEICP